MARTAAAPQDPGNSNTPPRGERVPGRGLRVAVIAPDGSYFGCIADAAAAVGMWPAQVSTRIKIGRGGWRRATPEEIRRHEAATAADARAPAHG